MVLCRALIFQLDVMWPPWVKQIEVGHACCTAPRVTVHAGGLTPHAHAVGDTASFIGQGRYPQFEM